MEFQLKLDAFKKKIKANKSHVDFKHVVELAKEYRAHITGIGLDDYLKQFNQREDDVMFAQRQRLTNSISKPTANSLKKPFYKVSRNRNIKSEIELKDKTRLQAVEKMISDFYGSVELNNKGLDYWLKNRFIELTFIDPNSWVVLEWDAKPLNEVVEPFPFELKSDAVYNYEMRNGVLKNLTSKTVEAQLFMNDKNEIVENNVDAWTFYEVGSSLRVIQFDPKVYAEQKTEIDLTRQVIWEEEESKKWFIATYNETNLEFIPAFRVGYLRDDATDGRTFVSPMDAAIPYFRKALKAVSELDLSITLHTFPQKIQFVSACKHRVGNDICQNGKMSRSAQQCSSCKGSGFEVHKSGQDAIYHKMPDDKSDLFDLDKTLVYKTPPIELIKFQDEYVKSLKQEAHLAIFNSTMFLLGDPQFKTATEVDFNTEGIEDTIFPYTEKFSEAWKTIVQTFVRLSGFKGEFKIKHIFPSDLKLKSTSMLVSQLQTANESQAPSFLIDQISLDIARQIYNGDEMQLKRFETRHKFFVFNGKSKEEIGLLLASPYVSEFTKILYANFEAIFTDIEKEHGVNFYFYEYGKQWEIVNAAVKVYQDEIKAQNSTEPFKFDFGTTEENSGVGNKSEGGEENPKGDSEEIVE